METSDIRARMLQTRRPGKFDLPTSGAIAASDIRGELGLSGAFNIASSAGRDLAGVPSGAISMSDYYGKSAAGWEGTITIGHQEDSQGVFDLWGWIRDNGMGTMNPSPVIYTFSNGKSQELQTFWDSEWKFNGDDLGQFIEAQPQGGPPESTENIVVRIGGVTQTFVKQPENDITWDGGDLTAMRDYLRSHVGQTVAISMMPS